MIDNLRRQPREFFATQGVFSLRNVVVMGIMLAVGAVLSRFSIYITPTFKAVSFAYLPGAMVAMLFGPWAAIAYGFVSDGVLFLANPQGMYFPGYAISEMTSYFIYACLLYRRPVTYLRALIARLLVMLIVVFALNFTWDKMLYGKMASAYYSSVRLTNNFVQWPVHSLLLMLVGRLVRRIGKQYPQLGIRS